MAATLPILQDVVERVAAQMPDIEVRLFPDKPDGYRFVHPKGAVLVGYQGSQFAKPHDVQAIVQQRSLTLHLTVFGRGVHNDAGALDLLDRLRLALTGHKPVHCNPIHLVSDAFLSEAGGVWQYELQLATETQQVQQVQPQNLSKLVQVYIRQTDAPLNPDIKPKP